MDIKKFLKKQGIDLDSLQKEGERVPKLLEALVKQNNGQVIAIKQILKVLEYQTLNQEKILKNQKNISSCLKHFITGEKP